MIESTFVFSSPHTFSIGSGLCAVTSFWSLKSSASYFGSLLCWQTNWQSRPSLLLTAWSFLSKLNWWNSQFQFHNTPTTVFHYRDHVLWIACISLFFSKLIHHSYYCFYFANDLHPLTNQIINNGEPWVGPKCGLSCQVTKCTEMSQRSFCSSHNILMTVFDVLVSGFKSYLFDWCLSLFPLPVGLGLLDRVPLPPSDEFLARCHFTGCQWQ